MTKSELCNKLDNILESYMKEVQLIASDPYSKRTVTEGEMVAIQQQIFYALKGFKESMVEYLK